MIKGPTPYPAYKDSGVPWLGEVPAHWDARRVRNVARMLVSNVDKRSIDGELPVRLCNYVDVYKNDHIIDRLPFMQASATREEVERFRLAIGDVLITKDSESWDDIGVPSLVAYEAPDLVCGYHLAILRPRQSIIHGSFLLRALQSRGVASQLHVSANGVTRYGLSHDAIKSVWIPVPPLPEQEAIARFLDHVDRHIRRYIRAKQRLIALLEEQKRTSIHHAVTRGLDPMVRLKPSGVAWLGDVPEHWQVLSLRHRFSVELGKMLDAKRITGEHLLPYLRNTDVQWDRIRTDDLPTMDIAPSEYARYTVADGDLLVCEGGEVGRAALWRDTGRLYGFQKALHRVRPICRDRDYARFLFYILFDVAKRGIFRADGSENTIAHLTAEKFRRYVFAFPPREEQAAISAYLDQALSHINAAIGDIQRELALLGEYRTRLVTDVVTGKLDVRSAVVGLLLPEDEPEEADDEADAAMDRDDVIDGDLDTVPEEIEV